MNDETSFEAYQDRQKKIKEVTKLINKLIDATEEQHKLDLANPEKRGKSKEELVKDSKRIQEIKHEAIETKQFLEDTESCNESPTSEDEE